MTNVERQAVFEDSPVAFDCAIDASGHCPASELLYREEEDPVHDLDMRAKDWAIFEDLLAAIAWGEDLPNSRHNYLHDGVWELKVGSLRATFYDTDGSGGYVAKMGIQVWEVGKGNRRVYDPDEIDEFLRLGHWFEKTGQKTPEEELAEAFRVREEDLSYDCRAEKAGSAVEETNPGAIEGSGSCAP